MKRMGLAAVALLSCLLAFPLAGQTGKSPKETAFEAVERNKDEVAKIGAAIFSYAELGMQEFETSAHWCAAIAEAGPIAHKGEVVAAKVLAGSIVDLLTKPELLAKAKETFKKEIAGSVYKPLLPADQKPRLDLNRAEMAKYRDLMKPHYLRVSIKFQ